jgi:hypothetical protein
VGATHGTVVKCVAQFFHLRVTDGCPEGFGECTIGPETGQVHIADLFGKLGGDRRYRRIR